MIDVHQEHLALAQRVASLVIAAQLEPWTISVISRQASASVDRTPMADSAMSASQGFGTFQIVSGVSVMVMLIPVTPTVESAMSAVITPLVQTVPCALKAFMEILVWKWVLPVAHVHAQAQWTLDIVLLTAVHLIPVLRMLYANVLMDMLARGVMYVQITILETLKCLEVSANLVIAVITLTSHVLGTVMHAVGSAYNVSLIPSASTVSDVAQVTMEMHLISSAESVSAISLVLTRLLSSVTMRLASAPAFLMCLDWSVTAVLQTTGRLHQAWAANPVHVTLWVPSLSSATSLMGSVSVDLDLVDASAISAKQISSAIHVLNACLVIATQKVQRLSSAIMRQDIVSVVRASGV